MSDVKNRNTEKCKQGEKEGRQPANTLINKGAKATFRIGARSPAFRQIGKVDRESKQ